MTKQHWIERWNSWIAPEPVLPGVFKRRDGGFLVRKRVMDPRTGKQKEVRMILLDATADAAYQQLQAAVRRIQAGETQVERTKTRFEDYAVSLLERKVATGEIKSAKTQQHWGYVLERHLFPAFGSFFIDQIRRHDVEAWRTRIGGLLLAGKYSPRTANGWVTILAVIVNSAVNEFELPRNPIAGVKKFDASLRPAYTEEEPNALTANELRLFLAEMRRSFPQHFAMTALGFATGLRPSVLRALRRSGPTPDVLFDQGVLFARRSYTVGIKAMETTKTGIRQRIPLPNDLVEILKWHVDHLPEGVMRNSELLFPSIKGTYRATTVLNVPFEEVAKAIKLTKHVSPRAMRRTFQDLARAASVHDLVTRAISGHATETMQYHYSSVSAQEVKAGLAKVIDIAGFKEAHNAALNPSGMQSGMHASEMEKAGGPKSAHERPLRSGRRA